MEETRQSKIVFRGLVIATIIVPLVSCSPFLHQLYMKIRMEFAQGADYHYRSAQYTLLYSPDNVSSTQLLSELMCRGLQLNHPIKEIMAGYERAKKLCPKLYSWSPHLIDVASALARTGHPQQSTLVFEDLCQAAEALTNDREVYETFKKSLPRSGRENYTFEDFQVFARGHLHNVQEEYARFLTRTKNRTPETSRRGLEIAEQLVKAAPTAIRLELLAQAQGTNGEFEEAIQTLEKAKEAHLPSNADPSHRKDLFLEKIAAKKILFDSRNAFSSEETY